MENYLTTKRPSSTAVPGQPGHDSNALSVVGEEPKDNEEVKEESVEKAASEKSLDLEEIFGFEEARRRAAEKNEIIADDIPEPTFIPHRVFINHVDAYHGKYFSEFLSDQIYGGSRGDDENRGEGGEGEEEDEGGDWVEGEEDEDGNPIPVRREPKLAKIDEKRNYEIIGTAKNPKYTLSESVKELISYEDDRDAFLAQILKCGFVIYDITTDPTQIPEAMWILQAIEKEMARLKEIGPKAFKNMPEIRCFILISTVMTWAMTKPIDPDDPSLPFTEADYRKRKPHPNFKLHSDLEKEVVALGKTFKDKFKTVVLCTGVTYGGEEGTLNFLFKRAWLNDPELPIFLTGKNRIPMINIQDLTNILLAFLQAFPPSSKFVLAVELQINKLKAIVTAISKALGSGRCKQVTKEEAFLIPEVTQDTFDKLTMNLNMEPTYIAENIDLNWVTELSFPENIQKLSIDYKEARRLRPIKICLHGPPAVGKTRVAKRLCEHYKLNYLNVTDVINGAINKMLETIERLKAKEKEAAEKEEKEEEDVDEEENEEEEDEEEDENQESIEEITELLEEVQENMAINGGKLDEEFVMRFFVERLMSNPFQNQGYVLDKFPKFVNQAKTLFDSQGEEGEGMEEEDAVGGGDAPVYNKKLMPEFVISLEASDDFLVERVLNLPELEVQGTRYTQELMVQRLEDFRNNNTEENTVLNYFDELEVHPFLVNVEDDDSPVMEPTVQIIINKIGKPRNFGPSLWELEEMLRKEQERLREEELERQRLAEELRRLEIERIHKNMEDWMVVWDKLKEEEERNLALNSMPLRHYLVQYVLPTLTKGLLEVAKVRPEDPLDYLAEFMFRENPDGKMFQPDYSEAAEELMEAIRELQLSILKINSIQQMDSSEILPGAIPKQDETNSKSS